MGSQIACEYALAGHDVTVVARNRAAVAARVDAAFDLAVHHGLADTDSATDARARVSSGTVADAIARAGDEAVGLVVESIVEQLAVKSDVLAPLAAAHPGATIATNTSSLSITAIGEAIGAAARTVGTHYWNPPLLMPLVEVVRGERTAPVVVDDVVDRLRNMRKTPVVVERDVPGFIWNRLQFALLREAVALEQDGVADAATIDLIVRDGLARRWVHTGPFQTAALGGAETFATVAANLFPHLSSAQDAPGLVDVADSLIDDLDELARRRDAALGAQVARDH